MEEKHGLSAPDALTLLEEIHEQALASGRRDEPLMVRVGEAIAKLRPKAEPHKADKAEPHKTHG